MRSQPNKSLIVGLTILLMLAACNIQAPTVTLSPVAPVAVNTPAMIPPTAPPALPVAASPSILSLDMLDANNGWAMTDAVVLRTMDGGATWYSATLSGFDGAQASSFFLDASNAWMGVMGSDPTTGTLYRTTDGGVSWTSATVPFGGGSLHFVDVLNGWELVGLNAGMSHESVAVFRTSDGGATWNQVFINEPGAPGSGDSLPLIGDKNGITALDATHAWVTGAQPSNDFIYAYTSEDGGSTWTQPSFTMPAGYSGAMTSASLPVFFGSNDIVLPVLLFANNNGTVFYESEDGGQTWTASTPVPQGGFLSVASALDFFVWDGGAALHASADGGWTWSTITPNVNIKDNMLSMQFVNATTGWALTSDASSHHTLYKTSDGGITWNVLIP
jgi:photosystem II stability/assembly factor-like uncharacterized protein